MKFMKKIFAEVGVGNETFFSTEIEEGEREYRIPKFIKPGHVNDVYLRIWIGTRVIILSMRDGLKFTIKPRRAFKVLIGLGGVT